MATTTFIRSSELLTRTKGVARVYTSSQFFSDLSDWTERPELLAQTVQFSCNSVAQATFRRHYGWIHDKGELAFSQVLPIELTNHWVAVDMPTTYANLRWYGVILGENREHFGAYERSVPSGNQIFTALNLAYPLTRTQLRKSRLWDGSAIFTVGRSINFNEFRSDGLSSSVLRGNKEPGHDLFAKNLGARNPPVEYWTAHAITRYLLREWVNAALDRPREDTYFQFAGASPTITLDTTVTDFVVGEVRADNQTVFDVLNQIYNAKRGLAWWVEYTGPTNQFSLRVETMAHAALFNPQDDEAFWPVEENENRIVLDLHDAVESASVVDVRDEGVRYDQVIVTGSRQRSVFTIGLVDSSLQADWSTQEQTAYLRGAKDTPNYTLIDRSEQAEKNDDIRLSNQLRHVFTRFRIPLAWNGKATGGEAGLDQYTVFPKLSTVAVDVMPSSLGASQPLWVHGMRFLPYLPLVESVDYATINSLPIDNRTPDSMLTYLRPFAVVKITNPDGSTKWAHADSVTTTVAPNELKRIAGIDSFHCSLRMHDHQAGVTLTPSGVSHKLYRDATFKVEQPSVAISNVHEGVTRYQDALYTVCAECDEEIYYSKPYGIEASITHDATSRLVIRLGDRARFDYLTQNTVLDVRNGALVRSPRGRALRDDRLLLRRVANEAWHWYQQPRRSVQATISDVRPDIPVGVLLSRIVTSTPQMLGFANGAALGTASGAVITVGTSGRAINSMVTTVTHNLEVGSTTLVTQFADLDFELLLG